MPRNTDPPAAHRGRPVLEIRLGDRLELRKPHACGGREWLVIRLGADIGLTCVTCSRRVLLERADLERRFGGWTSRGDPVEPSA